jgi:hypothetical protein
MDLLQFKTYWRNLITAHPLWGLKTVEFFDYARVVDDQKVFTLMQYPALIIEEPDETYNLDDETSTWDTTLMVVNPVNNRTTYEEVDSLKNDCRNILHSIIKELRFGQMPAVIIQGSPQIGYKSHQTGDNLVGAYAEIKIITPKTC